MAGERSVADGMAPFLRNGKCRRLSSHGLMGVCILLACIIPYREWVSIAWEGGVRCRYFGAKSCCATITFCRNSIRTKILYFSFTNRLLMSTGLLSPHLEPDFRLPNIPIPPLLKLRKKAVAPQGLLGVYMRKPSQRWASCTRSVHSTLTIRYPTPMCVWMYWGESGVGSSFLRRVTMKTRREAMLLSQL